MIAARVGPLHRLIRRVLAGVALVSAAWGAGPAAAQTIPGAVAQALDPATRTYDQVHLALDLRLDIEAGTVTGTATHRLEARAADTRELRFHCKDTTVREVTADGKPCTHAVADGLLTVTLPAPAAQGQAITLKIAYESRPTRGLYFFKPTPANPEIPRQVWSQGQGEDNRHWIPCYDIPDDRLTSEIRVTLPAGLTVIANGEPAAPPAKNADGTETHHWRQAQRHCTYLISLIAGTFDNRETTWQGIPVTYHVPPGQGAVGDFVFGRTHGMLAFYSDYTGRKYAWPRYAQTCVWDFLYGGMENTGATTLNLRAMHTEAATPDYSADGLISHELAHQWFGDLVTCHTFAHIWLNEGFATYFTDLWFEHHDGVDDFRVIRHRGQRRLVDEDLSALADLPSPGPGIPRELVGGKAYSRGAMVLHQLRWLLGDDVFRTGIRRWVADGADKPVTSEDFRASMEAASGRDLAWFFEQWIYGAGFPDCALRVEWDEAGKTLIWRLRQQQPVRGGVGIFRFPVEVEAVAGGTTWRRRLEVHRDTHEWRVPLPEKPRRVRWNRGGWVAARVDLPLPREWWECTLREDDDVTARLDAVEALGKLGAATAEPLARAAAKDAHWAVREAACEALGRLGAGEGGDAAVPALQIAAADPDSRVRRAACLALGACRSGGEAEPLLLARLRTDPKEYVRAAAVDALGKRKTPGAAAALREALAVDSHRDEVRTAALKALMAMAKAGDATTLAAVRPYVDYKWGKGGQHAVRQAALDAVVALAPEAPETTALLVACCGDAYFRMRGWAIEHLRKRKTDTPEVRGTLANLAAKDHVEGNRNTARAVLDALLGKPAPATPPAPPDRAAALRREAARLRLDADQKDLDARRLEAEKP